MATADELLAGMSTGDDTTLVIDNYLRTINIPKTITNLGVEHDDEVLTLNFKMPRYLDNTDLSTFAIRINYINANGDSDVYTVNDSKKIVGGDFIKFSWLVGPTATAYKGDTKFIVCMKILGDNGYVDKEYNTTIATLPVLEGLEVNPSVVIRYSDIIEQWRQEIFGEGKSVMRAIESASQKAQENLVLKGEEVLATIPEEYQETAEAAQEGIRTKADAIVNTVEGTAISVSDSSDDHLRGLRVFGKTTQVKTTGKNLLNVPEVLSLSNVQGIAVDIPAGTYIVTLTSETHSGDQQPYLRFYTNNVWIQLKNGLAQSAVLTQPETQVYLYTYGMSASESVGVTASLKQLMVSTTGGSYEPYSGGYISPSPDWPQEFSDVGDNGTVGVQVIGKNLLRDISVPATSTSRGLISDYEGNGVFHIHGTFSGTDNGIQLSTTDINIPINPDSKYTLSTKLISGQLPDDFHPYIGVGSNTVGMRNWLATHIDQNTIVGEVQTNTLSGRSALQDPTMIRKFWIYAHNDDLIPYAADFRIQIWLEESDSGTEFEPYVEHLARASTPNGLPGIPVKSDGNYTDSNGQQWICDEIDFGRGVYINRISVKVFTGSELFGDHIAPNGVITTSLWHKPDTNFLCTHAINWDSMSWANDEYISFKVDKFGVSSVNELVELLSAWNDAGNPLTVLFVHRTPVETALTADEIAAFKAMHSNRLITKVFNDSGAQMELKYNADTKTYVENGIQRTVAEVMEAIANGSY